MRAVSVSDDESIEALSVVVCVTHEISIWAILNGFSLDFEDLLQVLEEGHLLGVVLGIVFDVLLVGFEILDNILLLSQLRIEKLRVRLELVGKSLVWLGHE